MNDVSAKVSEHTSKEPAMKIFLPLILALALVGTAHGAATPAFEIKVSTNDTASVFGDSIPLSSKDDPTNASVARSGTEKSQCEDYGRSSQAQASARTTLTEQASDGVTVRLDASVLAKGGHFRTCLLGCDPVFHKCVGLHGNDTKAAASATPTALVTITFNKEYPPIDYLLDVATLDANPAMVVQLKDGLGNEIPYRRNNSEPQILRGRPGNLYVLKLSLPLSATDQGGCCSDAKTGSATIRAGIRIEKAPILDAKRDLVPYIAGGNQTTGFKNVGAIVLDGKLHCSGTLIAKQTILTAAHCIDGFEGRLKTVGFVIFGANLVQPDLPAAKIVDFAYPKSEQDSRDNYNPMTYDNDVGVLYLDTPLQIAAAALHAGNPAWTEVRDNQTNLTFVGFGYDVVEDQQVGLGIKREASWHISEVQERSVFFKVPGLNTCKGDSGGPAFLIQGGKMVQMAITSTGVSNDCVGGGHETRVDFYMAWIKPRLR